MLKDDDAYVRHVATQLGESLQPRKRIVDLNRPCLCLRNCSEATQSWAETLQSLTNSTEAEGQESSLGSQTSCEDEGAEGKGIQWNTHNHMILYQKKHRIISYENSNAQT